MYICNRCGHIIDELPKYAEIHSFGETYAREILQNPICPCCRNEMDAAETCKVCGEIKSEEENDFYGGICDKCLADKAKDLETVIECAKLDTNKEKVEVNPFLVFMFSPATIDEILWDYFNNICRSETFGFLLRSVYQKKAEEWAKGDLSWFGDTLEEVIKK